MSGWEGRLPDLTPWTRAACERPVRELAAALLGQLLLRREADGALTAGRIVEAEAYDGTAGDDSAHSFGGQTPRCATMFGPAGHAYIYATQGRCCCVNVSAGVGKAVLIRALEPVQGTERMRARRLARLGDGPTRRRLETPGGEHELAMGPGRLCLSLDIDRALDGVDLCDPTSPLQLVRGDGVPEGDVLWTSRIGLNPKLTAHGWPWRALVTGSRAVSPPRR